MDKAELARRVKEVAYLEGDFLLRSGRRSKYYLDKYLFETEPEILAELGRRLADRVGAHVDKIAGAELGAVPLAAAVSMACGKPYVIVRNKKKDYVTSKPIEGRLKKGDVVMLVEDVVTSGGQVLEAAKTLEEAGAKIELIVAVIDRGEGGREKIEEAGYSFESILTKSDLEIA